MYRSTAQSVLRARRSRVVKEQTGHMVRCVCHPHVPPRHSALDPVGHLSNGPPCRSRGPQGANAQSAGRLVWERADPFRVGGAHSGPPWGQPFGCPTLGKRQRDPVGFTAGFDFRGFLKPSRKPFPGLGFQLVEISGRTRRFDGPPKAGRETGSAGRLTGRTGLAVCRGPRGNGDPIVRGKLRRPFSFSRKIAG